MKNTCVVEGSQPTPKITYKTKTNLRQDS